MNFKSVCISVLSKLPFLKRVYSHLAWLKGRSVCYVNFCRPILKYKKEHTEPVFLIFTPEHENLGDHAIAYAEELLLKDLNIQYFEVTNRQLEILDYFKLMSIFNGAMLLVTGGGNLGSLWTWIEDINRQIIINNPDSLIMILPNTVYYGESEEDLQYLEESKEFFSYISNYYKDQENILYEINKN